MQRTRGGASSPGKLCHQKARAPCGPGLKFQVRKSFYSFWDVATGPGTRNGQQGQGASSPGSEVVFGVLLSRPPGGLVLWSAIFNVAFRFGSCRRFLPSRPPALNGLPAGRAQRATPDQRCGGRQPMTVRPANGKVSRSWPAPRRASRNPSGRFSPAHHGQQTVDHVTPPAVGLNVGRFTQTLKALLVEGHPAIFSRIGDVRRDYRRDCLSHLARVTGGLRDRAEDGWMALDQKRLQRLGEPADCRADCGR